MSKPTSHSKSPWTETLSLRQCAYYFNLPIQRAAVKLKVSRPTISKLLRKNGIARWPYRRLYTKQNIRLGALQNWNELKAMAVLATLKDEKLNHTKDLPNHSDDDEDENFNICASTKPKFSNKGSIQQVDTGNQFLNKCSISNKENSNNSSHTPSEQNCKITAWQTTHSPQNSKSITGNNNQYITSKDSLNSIECPLSFPVLDPSFPRPFSLPPAVLYDEERSFNSPTETDLDPSVCFSEKQNVSSLTGTKPLEMQDHYPQFIQRCSNMVVTPNDKENLLPKSSADGLPLHLTQEFGNECDPELGYQSVVNVSRNENNDDRRKFSDLDDEVGISNALNSPIAGTSVSDFGVVRDELVCPPHDVDNSLLDWDALPLSSLPVMETSNTTDNDIINNKRSYNGHNFYGLYSIDDLQTIEGDNKLSKLIFE